MPRNTKCIRTSHHSVMITHPANRTQSIRFNVDMSPPHFSPPHHQQIVTAALLSLLQHRRHLYVGFYVSPNHNSDDHYIKLQ